VIIILVTVWPQIPVFKGADKPILGKSINAGHFHGMDGLGDVPDSSAPGLDLVQKEGAVSAMIRLVNEYPGEVCVCVCVCLSVCLSVILLLWLVDRCVCILMVVCSNNVHAWKNMYSLFLFGYRQHQL